MDENKKTPLREKLESLEDSYGIGMPSTLKKQVIEEDGTFLVIDYIKWHGTRFYLVCSEFKGNDSRIVVVSGRGLNATKIVGKGLFIVAFYGLTIFAITQLILSIVK